MLKRTNLDPRLEGTTLAQVCSSRFQLWSRRAASAMSAVCRHRKSVESGGARALSKSTPGVAATMRLLQHLAGKGEASSVKALTSA